ncbi:MAG: hypothetical protein QNM02_03795 [Acidimicrobiia bacterium]|nr:hypothetical protein [Acidimicrobiia bacterium]
MILGVFGVGLFVFFLTVYGTVVAGGLMLTKEQIETTRELAPDLNGEGSDTDVSISDVIRSEL